jgi:hypothetical protein
MTISESTAEGLEKTQSLLRYAAHRLATHPGANATVHDVVSLSDSAVELIEAKVAMAVNINAVRAVNEMQKVLDDVVG